MGRIFCGAKSAEAERRHQRAALAAQAVKNKMKIIGRIFCGAKNSPYLCTRNPDKGYAQMAESVDALVSNTSGATHPGSIPGLGTNKSAKQLNINA